MASLHKDSRTGNWIVMFRWGGRQFRRSCETISEIEAKGTKTRIEQTTRLLKQGVLELPTDADPATWIISAGKVSQKPKIRRDGFGATCDDYLDNQQGKANSTMVGEQVHIRHLKRVLGEKTLLDQITLSRLQSYIKKRDVSGSTIRKELVTFRQVWDWAKSHNLTNRECPIYNDRRKWAVSLPKPAEKERFQTWEQIERRTAAGASEELWQSLFLDEGQVRDLLDHVRENAKHPFILPMFMFAAYTGARRSEILRSKREDFDFSTGQIRIREMKRRKNLSGSFRFVPLHNKLRKAISEWLSVYSGPYTIQKESEPKPGQMGIDMAHYHFKQVLKDSKWSVVRGFHVLRHSFGSNLARKGVPRETIAAWMGHSTQEMMEHYQHLFPQDWGDQISVLG